MLSENNTPLKIKKSWQAPTIELLAKGYDDINGGGANNNFHENTLRSDFKTTDNTPAHKVLYVFPAKSGLTHIYRSNFPNYHS